MDAMQNFLELIWLLHVIVYVVFSWVLRLKIQIGLLLLELIPCRIFLELILLLHVIIYAVFLGFKTEIPGLCVNLNGRHAEFSGTNLVT